MKNFLNSLNIKIEEKIKKFQNIYLVSLNCLNLPFSSFGKGFSEKEALKSAYGEMCERIICRNFLEDYYVNNLYPDMKKTEFLNEELNKFYKIDELEKEDLIDFNSDSFEILSVPFFEKQSKNKIYFPINLIQNLYASNGMAFHTSFEKAYYNAKTEIIERYVKFKIIKHALPIAKIQHPLNSKNIQIYDATLDGKYPVMAASYIKNENIILSFGCDLDKETAIKKAYLELLQTEFQNFGKITDDLQKVKDEYNLEKHFINLSGDIHINTLKPSLKKSNWNFENLDVFDKKEYYRTYKTKNFIAIQLIIPSISEIYPIDDLIYNNKNRGKFYRDVLLNYEKYNKEKVLDTLEELEYLGSDLDKFIGVIFDNKISPKEYEYLISKNKKPVFSQKYINIKKLSRKLNEIRQM